MGLLGALTTQAHGEGQATLVKAEDSSLVHLENAHHL